ncbi:hypothetical protein ACTI_43290 [Actinoplanes sp. OR16]|uniref:hypothetical protein n=1 Tax=Actinoplanes sp. OR16 TaxID=946334 RepID=UPI000F6D1FEF|nr:hypothetical protein [Actinoplanes sp. OR16]BBH67644.1 hypothetical protein ACTI_43290 [Actinoplanes sp. OR16]
MVIPAAVIAVVMAANPVAAGSSPSTVCRITDDRLNEISGLLTDGSGYVVVNDGADDPDGRKIFFLNRKCKVVRTVSYPSRPRDTEDLARGPDGTIWVGDIGDNGGTRTTIALWRLAPGARKPSLFRLSYPDGAHDAEALLISGDGTPVVITKDPVTAGLYVPTGPLRSGRTTPLRRAGDVAIPLSGTTNPFGFAGRLVITGAGQSSSRVVLRTYADAFEYDLPDGDVVAALTKGSTRTTALPDEPQGESITFSADGSSLLTVSEGTDVPILSYPLPPDSSPPAAVSPSTKPSAESPQSESPQAGSPRADSSQAGSPQAAPAQADAVPAAREFPLGATAAAAAMIVAGAALGLLLARRRHRR